jgi:cytochrome c nitrite reductase small subunit
MSPSMSILYAYVVRIVALVAPPHSWRPAVAVLLGIGAGLGLEVFHVSNAASYLSDAPETCINCHIMTPEYAGWRAGSHGRVTTCNDCHVPHDHVWNTYLFKAKDGLRHSAMFTFRMEPQVITISESGAAAVQANCLRCHGNLVAPVLANALAGAPHARDEGRRCWECHREVPHGRVHGLASAPGARVPRLAPVLPEWMGRWHGSAAGAPTKK